MNYNNNYYPQYQQQQMNYQYPQYQYQSPSIPQQVIVGRIIDDESTIQVNEIPMDGNYAFFPKRDMSEIVVRNWNKNGSINSLKYTLEKDNVNNLPQNTLKEQNDDIFERTDAIMTRLDMLENKIDELKANNLAKSTTKTTRKEVAE